MEEQQTHSADDNVPLHFEHYESELTLGAQVWLPAELGREAEAAAFVPVAQGLRRPPGFLAAFVARVQRSRYQPGERRSSVSSYTVKTWPLGPGWPTDHISRDVTPTNVFAVMRSDEATVSCTPTPDAAVPTPEPEPHQAGGVKKDAGKPDFTLVPFSALEGVVRVMQSVIDSGKYPRDNWKHVADGRQRYCAAGLRHRFQRMEEGVLAADPESGELAIDHELCSLLFERWFIKQETGK